MICSFLPFSCLEGFNKHLEQGAGGADGTDKAHPLCSALAATPLLSNLFPAVSEGSAGPVLSLPTASLGQLFTSRFTFLLIFLLPSELPFPPASPLAIKWVYCGK